LKSVNSLRVGFAPDKVQLPLALRQSRTLEAGCLRFARGRCKTSAVMAGLRGAGPLQP
jgi:hypothetical protein